MSDMTCSVCDRELCEVRFCILCHESVHVPLGTPEPAWYYCTCEQVKP
ncbi:MAG: hypothetical protein HWN66_14550 [Candidatus Helarchaeota archaeon]|nr:hypothetical protein [Candidatus Helarchaeota archaeon]